MMTIYSDTLHWSGIRPIFDPITDLDLITEFDFLPICERFPKNICSGCGMPLEDAYSSVHLVLPTLGLASVLMLKPIFPELVLFPDFWVSNIPRYFSFLLPMLSSVLNQVLAPHMRFLHFMDLCQTILVIVKIYITALLITEKLLIKLTETHYFISLPEVELLESSKHYSTNT